MVFLVMTFRSQRPALISLKLPSGTTVNVPTCRMAFKAWTHKDKNGRPVTANLEVINTFGRKEVLDHHGEPVFAELAILRLLTAEKWDGRWVTNHRERPKFRTGLLDQPPCELPPGPKALFKRIATGQARPNRG